MNVSIFLAMCKKKMAKRLIFHNLLLLLLLQNINFYAQVQYYPIKYCPLAHFGRGNLCVYALPKNIFYKFMAAKFGAPFELQLPIKLFILSH